MKTLLKNVNLIDGTLNCEVRPNTDILLEDNKIAKIGSNLEVDKDVKVYDLSNKYVTPGMINLHVHLPSNGKAPWKNSNNKALVKLITEHKILHPVGIDLGKKYALEGLKAGVTTVRAVGGVADFDTKLRDQINSGKAIGPRIYAANMAIAVPNGHMVGTVSVATNSIEEAIAKVHSLKDEGVDLIKIMITGGVLDAEKRGEPGILRMNADYVKAICDEAHKLGFQVAAHVESFEGLKIAVENGVDTIEHGSHLDDETVAKFKEHKAAFVATFSPAVPLAVFNEEESGCNELVQYNTFIICDSFIKGVRTALKEGIPLGLGTDTGCPFVAHYNFYRELIYFKNLTGVSNSYALYTGTLNNAKILKKDDIIGSIEENKLADILVFDKNPLDDLKNLSSPVKVMKDGKFLKSLKFKKNKYADSLLDRLMTMDVEKVLKEKFN